MPRHIKAAALAGQQEEADAKIRSTVESIIEDVAKRGDAAVRELSERFDKWSPPSFRLGADDDHRHFAVLNRVHSYTKVQQQQRDQPCSAHTIHSQYTNRKEAPVFDRRHVVTPLKSLCALRRCRSGQTASDSAKVRFDRTPAQERPLPA